MPLRTPLYEQHKALNATIVEFAGYEMPVRYSQGLIEEHLWVRKKCGVFDVSHMGQIIFKGNGLNQVFSRLTPSNFEKIKHGTCKYTVLTNKDGGIIDDLIITKFADDYFFVVWNASRKHINLEHALNIFPDLQYNVLENRALIAVQGPETFSVLAHIFPEISKIEYMKAMEIQHKKYGNVILSRTGYTGEKGFEISLDGSLAKTLWNELLEDDRVCPIGLGARDTLRLEAGYPLYGNDINTETNPISAGLSWVMSKGHDGYIGQNIIANAKQVVKRVGVLLEDKGVLRAGYEIFDSKNNKIGVLTSGGYSPILEKSIGQAYLPTQFEIGQEIFVNIRGKMLKAIVSNLSFVATNPK